MESRVKSIYSIYRKMYLKGHSSMISTMSWPFASSPKTEMNCYEILGIIHATYKPIPGRFKDYIAMPKPNMYQSLHTCIVSGDGQIYEVQIRTEEMDQIAETGVAAHWRYTRKAATITPKKSSGKSRSSCTGSVISSRFRASKAMGRPKNTWRALSNDIFGANVYVFTPLRQGRGPPTGATTLDFAYKIHTKVGDSAVGAIVNGTMVPLSTVLKDGRCLRNPDVEECAGPESEAGSISPKPLRPKATSRKAFKRKTPISCGRRISAMASSPPSKASRPKESKKRR
jgi:guanosine-3',5'-bis(diphosphate) 3'-pyrophosphohydrolase